ncbi:hypothetical protein JHK87_010889 [Glycine soja]|nr:hypothetical protein JHK87_010889 [Glycine soja]
MVAEIIDLSDSPPSSPSSSHNTAARILNFDSVSNGKIQFEKVIPISLMACTNTNQPQNSRSPGLTENMSLLFFVGLIKYGRGHWSKIARQFLLNKTPHQVQSYGASFFRHLPSTHLHGFRRRKPTYSTSSLMPKNNNLMAASVSMPMIVNELQQQTHMLFPENAPFLLAPSHGEASSSNNTTMYGFQVQTGGARTSMNASANGEVDLELRLG